MSRSRLKRPSLFSASVCSASEPRKVFDTGLLSVGKGRKVYQAGADSGLHWWVVRADGNLNMRVDRWLWFTRFYKTRALAGKAVAGGHVSINGVRAKPSSSVSTGDAIELVRDQLTFSLQALELPVRRGPAAEARLAYTEDQESVSRREEMLADIRADRRQMPRTAGKPDKHTRRLLRTRSGKAD